MEFEKIHTSQIKNRFEPTASLTSVLKLVKDQKVPGQLIVTLPGNGGVTSIEFVEKAKVFRNAELAAEI
jgi:hypothetical protein